MIELIYSDPRVQGQERAGPAVDFKIDLKKRPIPPLGYVQAEQYQLEKAREERYHPFRSFGIGAFTDSIEPHSGMLRLPEIGVIETISHCYEQLGVDFLNSHIREWYGLLGIAEKYATDVDGQAVLTSHTVTVLPKKRSISSRNLLAEISLGLDQGKRFIVLNKTGEEDGEFIEMMRRRIAASQPEHPEYPSAVITFNTLKELAGDLEEVWKPVLNGANGSNHWLAGLIPDVVRIYGFYGEAASVLSKKPDGSVEFTANGLI